MSTSPHTEAARLHSLADRAIAVAAVTPAAIGAVSFAVFAEGPTRALSLLILLVALVTWTLARRALRRRTHPPATEAIPSIPAETAEPSPGPTSPPADAGLEALFERLAQGVVVTTTSGIIEAMSPAAEAMFGHDVADLLGKPLRLLLPGLFDSTDPELVRRHATRIAARGAAGELLFGLRADYQAVSVRCACAAITWDDRQALAWLLTNLSAVQTVEEQIEMAVAARVADLEHEATERRQADVEARRASEARSQFLANMSHELRTPLNAIIGYAELIEEEAEEAGNDEILPDLRRIQQAAHHQLVLINDVLDLARIEAGRLELAREEIEVAPLVHEVLATVRPLAERNDTRLGHRVEPDATHLTADPVRLRQALYNLLSNACKFTERGSVLLHVAVTHDLGAPHVAFEVVDTGIGIDADRLDQVFEPFVQEDGSTTRRFGGTGLGLSLTRNLCRLMGGDVIAESEKGHGSTFTILLPLARADAPPASPTSINAAAAAMNERLAAHDMASVAAGRRQARESGALLARSSNDRASERALLDETLRALASRPQQIWDESIRPDTGMFACLTPPADVRSQTDEHPRVSRSTGELPATQRKDVL